jgi:hypothetical protein
VLIPSRLSLSSLLVSACFCIGDALVSAAAIH